ncbi:ABC transporter substrate-binding protein [Ornithinimicrobium sufpigmenti]|uniref:ABC transporter substrate-binding protein n=1 Tax=Ornithinimicrobium sufpigmenti TaxID=2508882 RepID=UPI001035F2D4|nr:MULTISPECIES: ABC transporter substrate-binding protein [unclassified Ornithinimicrobium]
MSTRRTLTATLIATALLAACGQGGSEPEAATVSPPAGAAASETFTIGLTYTPDVQFSPFYVAQERGYFEDAGVQVELRHHGASEGLFSAAISGEEDLVVAGGDEMLQAVAEGADLVATATLYQDYPVVLVVPEDSDIQGLTDLPGHSVGVPGEFGQTWFGLQVLLDQLGPAAEEVQVETIGFTQLAAITSGHVDTVMGFVNNEPVRLQEQGVATRTIPLEDDVPLVGISLIATGPALDEDAEAVQAVNDAVLRAVADIVADPQVAVDAAEQYVPDLGLDEARSAALATVEATVPLYGTGDQIGALDPERWTQMADFMGQHGLLSAEVDVEGLLHQP